MIRPKPEMKPEKNILVAPLNWGLGHAARCIPIVRALMEHGFSPVLASDGQALALLQKEFPELPSVKLPSYGIEYPRNGWNFKWKMLQNAPKMMAAFRSEKKQTEKLVTDWNLKGIISDNRPGVISKKAPSVYITHQLNVLTGNTTWLTGKLHRAIIRKFSECWVPDVGDIVNLSGRLGHLEDSGMHLRYIGPLSRFQPKQLPVKYELMVLLSGPEPQRTILEEKLRNQLEHYPGCAIFIKGVVEPEQQRTEIGNVTYYNFMTSAQLEKAFNESRAVLCRSGYTTVMDLAKLGKKAFLIPTPGQYEQEYLARKFKKDGLLPSCRQEDFRIGKLQEIARCEGLPKMDADTPWEQLFCLFGKA